MTYFSTNSAQRRAKAQPFSYMYSPRPPSPEDILAANGIDATNSNEAENSKEKRPDITALHVKTLARTLISNTFYQFYMGGR
jgi:glutamate synthase domain-containing protein 1